MAAVDHILRIDQRVIDGWQAEGFIRRDGWDAQEDWEVVPLNPGEDFFYNLSSLLWNLCLKVYYFATTAFCILFGIPCLRDYSSHFEYSYESQETLFSDNPQMNQLIEERSQIFCMEAALNYIKPSYKQNGIDTVLQSGLMKIFRHAHILDIDPAVRNYFASSLATKDVTKKIFQSADENNRLQLEAHITQALGHPIDSIASEEVVSLFNREDGFGLMRRAGNARCQVIQDRNLREMSGENNTESIFRGLSHFAVYSKNQKLMHDPAPFSPNYQSTAIVTIGRHSYMVGITRSQQDHEVIEATLFHPSSHAAVTGYSGAGILSWKISSTISPLEEVALYLEAFAQNVHEGDQGFSIEPAIQRVNFPMPLHA